MARHSVALLSLALTALAACGDTPGVNAPASTALAPSTPSFAAGGRSVVEGRYIVAFKPGVARGHLKIQEKLTRANGRLKHSYNHAIHGFAADLSAAAAAALRADPDVAFVEADPVISISATQSNAIWGLDRIDQAALPLSTSYTYANDGGGVTVYILDTGINTGHAEFGGRAVPGYDAITPGGTAGDCHGHGTHVAGTVGGALYGVAKGVTLVAVRVLDCAGSGTGSGLLAGLDWIAERKAASPATPMIMNMSLGGSASQVLDDAVQNVVDRGVTAAVAAGNAGTDACTASPARLPAAITVGATDSGDNLASFSNRGPCVDLHAPGVAIYSAWYGSTTGGAGMSGTSMAAPHVAGAAALYLKANPTATPAQVATALAGNSVSGVVKSVPTGTVNKLLNISFLAAAPPPGPTLSVSPTSASLTIGATTALSATVGNPVSGGTVTWVSRNTAVATVASTGATTANAKAVAAGSAYVVATYTAGSTVVRDSALVTVAAPTITVSPRSASLAVGGTATLSATIGNAAANGTLSWTSRNPAVAEVAAAGATTATLTAAAPGATYIVASYVAGGTTVVDSVAVTVATPKVSVSPKTASVLVGAQTTLAASVTDGGTGGSITWTSRNTAVASVSGGVVTGVGAGSVYVVATYTVRGTSARDSAQVTVTAASTTPPLVGKLVAASGDGCLTEGGGSGVVQLVACGSIAGQTWTTPAVGTPGKVSSRSATLCLVAWNGGGAGSYVATAPCSGTSASSYPWTWTAAGELRYTNGLCATVTRASYIFVQLQSCTGSATQRWTRS